MRLPWLALTLLAGTALGQQMRIVRDEPLPIRQNGKYGYIDHRGRVVIKPQFYWAGDFEDGTAEACVCGRLVSIDRTGRVVPHRFPLAGQPLVPYRKNDKTGFVDAGGQFRIPPRFEEALWFSDGLAAVKIGDKWGFIDASGNVVIAPRFDDAFYFYGDLGVAELDGRSVLIDRKGDVVTAFDGIAWLAEGRASIGKDSAYEVIDFAGRVIVPPIYQDIREFNGGLAVAENGSGKWGYIDREGNVRIPFRFDQADSFHGKLAAVRTGTTTGFIDRQGRMAFTLRFVVSAGFVYGDVAQFRTGHHPNDFGYVNESGKVIWGPDAEDPYEERGEWTDEGKAKSCEGVPESVRREIASFPDVP